jgi:uncharacterized protein
MIPLRLVLDTNVVVSAALKSDGLQRSVLLLALQKPARLYVSAEILDEYRAVLSRPQLRIRKGLRRRLVQVIENRAYRVVPSLRLRVTKDPDDNIFLECADAAKADFLVTGNSSDFPRYWKRTKIITSREFLGIIAPHLLS